MTPQEFWGKAAEWGSCMTGGDPSACMYGFDERGMVQSEEHRRTCIEWLDKDCREAAKRNPPEDNNIDDLIRYLKTAPIITRSIALIAREIRRDWKDVWFAARPYLDAMADLNTLDDMYGADSGEYVVTYFLSNAARWRGETAKRIKAELNNMVRTRNKRRK